MCLRAVMFLFVCVPIVYGDQPSSAPDKYTETTLKEVESFKPRVVNGASLVILGTKKGKREDFEALEEEYLVVDWKLIYEGVFYPRNFLKPEFRRYNQFDCRPILYVETVNKKICAFEDIKLPFIFEERADFSGKLIKFTEEHKSMKGKSYYFLKGWISDIRNDYPKEFPPGFKVPLWVQFNYINQERGAGKEQDIWTGTLKSNIFRVE